MVWLTKWVIENVADSRVVIITDRDELDDQIESLFIDVNEKVRRTKQSDLREIPEGTTFYYLLFRSYKEYLHNAGKHRRINTKN